MTAPVLLLIILINAGSDEAATTSSNAEQFHFTRLEVEKPLTTSQAVLHSVTPVKKTGKVQKESVAGYWYDANSTAPSDSIIAYALSLIGSPYVYGGTSDSGFDCSGFTSHVFQEFDVPITRSSTTQSQDGLAVDKGEARPGDLVIFTGTNPAVREPGHVGIVISEPGDVISFVHSSSNGGVKISQVEGTGYDKRFLGVRRLL